MKKHPNLSHKFQVLHALRVNPAITSNAELARRLKISRQAVSKWCRGTSTLQGDAIPDYLINKIAALYRIDPHWFALPEDQFELLVQHKVTAGFASQASTPQVTTSALPITSLELFGRTGELEQLQNSWEDPRVHIVQVIGFGGVGKSALVNKWLSNLSRERFHDARRVYAWSFARQGQRDDIQTSGDFFIEHALQWFGDSAPGEGSSWAKAARLSRLLREYKTLLVLDGLEPLQCAPGPRVGEVENPAVSALIRDLAVDCNGLCLITSRLAVADLQPYRDGRVWEIRLQNLPAKDGKRILKKYGIKGHESEFDSAIARYRGHPLSLMLLGAYLSIAYDSEIGRFRDLNSLLTEKKLGDQGRHLVRAYLDWFEHTVEIQLLFWIALFDRAVALSQVREIVASTLIAGLTDRLRDLEMVDWHYAIDALKQTNLISADHRQGDLILDCHPIVRDYIAGHLLNDDAPAWAQAHGAIFELLQASAVEDPQSMTELEPLFRAVLHGVAAGQELAAFALYYEKIKQRQFSLSTEGSHHADHACISAFFEEKWLQPKRSLPEESQVYLLSSAATNLIYLGHIEAAVQPCYKSIQWFVANGRWLDAATATAPLLSMLIVAGQLDRALGLIEEMESVVEQAGNPVVNAMAANFKAYLLYLNGQSEIAQENFRIAEEILVRGEPLAPAPFPTISAYYCKFLLDTGNTRAALERMLKTFAWRRRGAWQVRIDTSSLLASDTLVLGLILLRTGDLINARRYLEEQVELFRRADERLYLPSGLISRACYHRAVGDLEAARRDLLEAVQVSSRTGALLGQWEACLELAQLSLLDGNFVAARDYLQQAMGLPGMSAYRFRDHDIAELRRALGEAAAT